MAKYNERYTKLSVLLLIVGVLKCDSYQRESLFKRDSSEEQVNEKSKWPATSLNEGNRKGDHHGVFKEYYLFSTPKKGEKPTISTSRDGRELSEMYSRRASAQTAKGTLFQGSNISTKSKIQEQGSHITNRRGSQSNSFETRPTYSVSKPFGSTGHPLMSNKTQDRGHKTVNRVTSFTHTSPNHFLATNSDNVFFNPPTSVRAVSGRSSQNSFNKSPEPRYIPSSGNRDLYRDVVKQILLKALAIVEEGEHPSAITTANCGPNGQMCPSQEQGKHRFTMREDISSNARKTFSHILKAQTEQNTVHKSPKLSKHFSKMLDSSVIIKNDHVQRNKSALSFRSIQPAEQRDSTQTATLRLNSLDSHGLSDDNNNDNDNNNGNQNGGLGVSSNGYPSTSGSVIPVDQSVFNRFASETMSFERQSASEITRLDNLLRQLALAAQTDFSTVSSSLTTMRQELLQSQQQLVQAWQLLNLTHTQDKANTESQLHAIKTDVYRLHALLTGETPMGQSTAQGRVAEVREETVRAGLDCAALAKSGVNSSGVYDLQPDTSNNQTRMTAYCDMDTNGGGWTVFQRRKDGSDDFFRGWNSYKHGFGSYHHDHWLGLENIHLLTKYGDNVMRIELTDWENETRWAEFSYTRIMGESDGYRILVGGYHGNAGDPFHSLAYDMRMQSMRFSTFDSDNDMDNGGNCALTFTSGWWFNKCFQINLNGVWYGSSRYAGPSMNGIVWDLWPEHFNGYSLKQTEMKLRPNNFARNK